MKHPIFVAVACALLAVAGALVGLLLAPPSSAAESASGTDPAGIVFPAGKWDFKIKITMPGESRPTVQEVSACMNGGIVTPGGLMPWLDEQGCEVVEVEVEEQKMEWKLDCNMQGQPAHGRGRFEIDGQKAKGRSKIDIRVAGNSVSIATKWSGKHAGECDTPEPAGAD